MIQPVKVRSSAGYCARVPAQFVGRRMGSLEKLGGEERTAGLSMNPNALRELMWPLKS